MNDPTSETTQDVLDEHERVLVELFDDSRLVEVEDPDSYRDRYSYRVETATGFEKTFEDGRRAKHMIALYALVDAFEEPAPFPVAIPLDVVTAGRPAVATYLYAVREWSSEDVANALDVSRRTVWDYLYDVRQAADLPLDY